MDLKPLPFRSALEPYHEQAQELLEAYRSGDSQALRVIHENHPRFLDSGIPSAPLELADAQLTIARWYSFQDWPALAQYVEAVTRDGSAVCRFESAAEAVITGDLATLESMLREKPELVRERSARITRFDPSAHRATLLHYIAANGVENHRQMTPKNAVEAAHILLRAGAEVDALAGMYGGQYTTMSMLASSSPPAKAGVQVALVEALLDFGAALEGRGPAAGGPPLMTALAFGHLSVAEALVRRGARADHLVAAAGLGRLADAAQLLATADSGSRHRALALAAQHGHADIVRLLLEAGEDPSRYNPDGHHSHSTPLHQAALAGHAAVVRLLAERGARLDIKDTVYQQTPLDWAMYAGQTGIAAYLVARGAKTAEQQAR